MTVPLNAGLLITLALLGATLCREAPQKSPDQDPDKSRDLDEVPDAAPDADPDADPDAGWGEWSPWSECSRTCDGGASYQLRQCSHQSRACAGDGIRYRTCNNEPCASGSRDFRSQQCTAYKDVAYRGVLYDWVPADDASGDACVLRCRARGQDLTVVLAPKVLDGTRCSRHSNHMCINGQCRSVGCDHVLGSEVKVDECGVCGGNGLSCRRQIDSDVKQPLFVWTESDFSDCSVTCGVGEQRTQTTCVDSRTGDAVYRLYCDRNKRPPSRARTCKRPACHPVWITGEWLPCSRTCGGGISRRNTYCVKELEGGAFQRIPDSDCGAAKSVTSQECNQHECPLWVAGQWSPCSVTCGDGAQYREVICKKTKDHACAVDEMPITSRSCRTGVTCLGETASADNERAAAGGQTAEARRDPDRHGVRAGVRPAEAPGEPDHGGVQGGVDVGVRPAEPHGDPDRGGVQGGVEVAVRPGITFETQPPPPVVDPLLALSPHGEYPQFPDDPYPPGGQSRLRHLVQPNMTFIPFEGDEVEALYLGEEGGGDARPLPSPPVAVDPPDPATLVTTASDPSQLISTQPRFTSDPWGPCSATCGEGFQNRKVTCRVYLEFSRTLQDLPDQECDGPKPTESQMCLQRTCDVTTAVDSPAYLWRYNGYGACSAQCLTGQQHARYTCTRRVDHLAVSSIMCANLSRPNVGPRECNTGPCQPRWDVRPLGPCSMPCGGGHQYRRRLCVQQYGRESGQLAYVPNSLCPLPDPPEKIICNTQQCRPQWGTTPWSECSVKCGLGVRRRRVQCEQHVGPGRTEVIPHSAFCDRHAKPAEMTPCQVRPCEDPAEGNFLQQTDSSSFVQLRPKKKVCLLVGGKAYVIPGTTVKIRCPVARSRRDDIVWRRGSHVFGRRGRVRSSTSGVLRLRKAKLADAGTYTCEVVGGDSANTTLTFHSTHEAAAMLDQRLALLSDNFAFVEDMRLARQTLPARQRDDYSFQLLSSLRAVSELPFVYVAWRWSPCSMTCGGAGLKRRRVACELLFEDYTLMVDEAHCRQRGLDKPLQNKDCGYETCPHWEVGQWSECSSMSCVQNGVGERRRNVLCVAYNGSTLETTFCDQSMIPPAGQPCSSDFCVASWNTSDWNECSKSCGNKAFKSRLLRCVWKHTLRPAGANCRTLPRPKTRRKCKVPACSKVFTVCKDASKYCTLVPMLKLCRYNEYRQRCCNSCDLAKNEATRRRRLY